MRMPRPIVTAALVLFSGTILLGSASHTLAAVTITKAKMINKTAGGEVTSGMADAYLSVDFVAVATTDCDNPALTYTWTFGDGTTATGASVSHTYGAAGAGDRTASVTVTDTCGGSATQGGLTINAISGIKVTTIGDITNPTTNGRLCFDTVRSVAASALPAGVTGSNKIDWYIAVGAGTASLTNSASGNLSTLSAWPASNSSWGGNTLYISIDGPHVAGQEGELILTGTASFLTAASSVKVFYQGKGTQKTGSDPNWFYYYKDNAGGGAYTYGGAGTSSSTSGGGVATIRVGDTAYDGQEYITHDYSNPGGRLKATGWSATFKYYTYFKGVLAHETQHATNETPGDPTDTDGDDLAAAFETGTSLTDPTVINSSDVAGVVGFNDDEVYAGGPVEKSGIDGADTSADWAKPGTNWP